jgi:hypothetical protein
MVDFLLLLLVVVIFFAGVQIGATIGSIGQMIRWVADWVDSKLKKDKQ